MRAFRARLLWIIRMNGAMNYSMLNDRIKSRMKIGIPKETKSNENCVAPAWLTLDTEWKHIESGQVILRIAAYSGIL
ncbi:MAG: hypothetical protein AWT59_2495 [Candidatus Gallionella acididurans]|uniref:Uncharacterized protein n=1 Tax=Candidatus Gallionella acididurans TaxID=1796491 RepID=A0A139BQY8_9PROT|nr:MAG: hypothetical protein AWT59_2495 [Candidatus Gallionella acididurans]